MKLIGGTGMLKRGVIRKDLRNTHNPHFVAVKKGAAILGTTMIGCSIAAPLVQPTPVFAEQAAVQANTINTTAFITEIATYAQPIAQANDLYTSVMVAQAVIESGWGTSSLARSPYYNLFGIKGSYEGQTATMDTSEYLNGEWVTLNEPFRQYSSFQESFADNAAILRTVSFGNGYYYSGVWKSNTTSYRDATASLEGTYATDPGYAQKLNSVIETYGLTQYDGAPSGNAGGGATVVTSSGTADSTGASQAITTSSEGSKTYTVQAGESVWSIANSNGITIDQLVAWNNIQDNFVYPGQQLNVGSSSQSTSQDTSTSSTATNTQTSTSSSQQGTYTVQEGESVWGIAEANGITMDQLISWNNLENNFVYPGRKLIVNQGSATNSSPSTTNSSSGKYTVQPGESVWSVSDKNGITMDQLIAWNNIHNNYIYPGQTLTVTN